MERAHVRELAHEARPDILRTKGSGERGTRAALLHRGRGACASSQRARSLGVRAQLVQRRGRREEGARRLVPREDQRL
jgi:hypothetical protein